MRKIRRTQTPSGPPGLQKVQTGINGLDEITGGGLPSGRPTLICGGPGCGKSLFGIEFLVRGARDMGEPGVMITFEESPEEITRNVASLGFDIADLERRNLLAIDYIHVERSQIEENGEFDLEGLFVRIGLAIDTVGAKRIVLDTLEALFSGFANEGVLRAELRRLFRWLKERGVTAVITGERGDASLTRQGLEEYVSDCVILLDHRVIDQISTRRLRVVKYRGTAHATNEYPFLIDEEGITVMPITSIGLQHEAPTERISSGIPRLDAMLGGEGFYRGSSVLVSGTAGTGKSSLGAHFASATCKRGERCLYFAFEESPSQIMRNMRTINLDLQPLVTKDILRFHATRPSRFGLETHLAIMLKKIRDFQPTAVVIDPMTNFLTRGDAGEVLAMLTRLVDYLKQNKITALYTSLTHGGTALEASAGVSSIMDTWILLRDIELNGERNRAIYVLKSRGMHHSNQVREFVVSERGIDLRDVYIGPEGVLTGSSRIAQESREQAQRVMHDRELLRKQREMERKRQLFEAQVASLQLAYEADEAELERMIADARTQQEQLASDRVAMSRSRQADAAVPANGNRVVRTKGNR